MIYGVISDTHNHNWSAFSSVGPDGVNTRLQSILDETWRAAKAVKDAGGKLLIHTGDLFHVRGSVAPSVLNPTRDLYYKIVHELELDILFLGGNHDFEGREGTRIGNAMSAMTGVGRAVYSEPRTANYLGNDFYVVPWQADLKKLKETLEKGGATYRAKATLLIHSPIDGVLKGIPPSGLDPTYLAGLGYRLVLSGHYHHHKEVWKNVYSVGALTHQTWSDVGSKAGFLLVEDDLTPVSAGVAPKVTWHESHAPKFVDLSAEMSEPDMFDAADGNYVRVRMTTGDAGKIAEMREALLEMGALGVTVLAEPPSTTVARAASAVRTASSLEASVDAYVAAASFANPKYVTGLCAEILAQARAA